VLPACPVHGKVILTDTASFFFFVNFFLTPAQSVGPVRIHATTDEKDDRENDSAETSRIGPGTTAAAAADTAGTGTRTGTGLSDATTGPTGRPRAGSGGSADGRPPPLTRLASHLIKANMTGRPSSVGIAAAAAEEAASAGSVHDSPQLAPSRPFTTDGSTTDLNLNANPTSAEYARVVEERDQLRQRLALVQALISNRSLPGTSMSPSAGARSGGGGGTGSDRSTTTTTTSAGTSAVGAVSSNTAVSTAAIGAIITGLSRRLATLASTQQTRHHSTNVAALIADVLREFKTIESLLTQAQADKSMVNK
jgi:hypothetical protein